ncbi:carbohydrate kinase family protein [Aerococcus sp. UMB8623]|uniref:carbohydrate kinase family protein n=1 Tax=Aerococcus sp. UMB8623 TaxID=3046348 RepID=UPI002549EAB5|nr:carbohydrate kinase family protein [Aerococcus sp. UMB8623]MDK6686158.1 carbohydrate kinase family protein [Aerococcus sp. UMB8623]
MDEKYVVVVGGLNIDIAGLSGPIYHPKDSNIGEVSINVGGVGHNIANNLTNLETPTYLITVYGDDHFGSIAKAECEKNNISLDYAEQVENSRSSIYLYVNDNEGDLVTGINDMKILEHITPEFLEKRLEVMNKAELLVLDCNLTEEAIEWIGNHVKVPIMVDPVSVAKVGRLKNIIDKLDTIKPNEHEIEILTGIKVTDEASAVEAAANLNKQGVSNVFISLGAKGILLSRHNGKEVELVSPIAKRIVSTNGAGDCTMATIAWTRFFYKDTLTLSEIGLFTQAAASINLESPEAVAPELNIRNVVHRAQDNYKGD